MRPFCPTANSQTALARTALARTLLGCRAPRAMVAVAVLTLCLPFGVSQAHRSAPAPEAASQAAHRTRLILKDGTYQLVMSYTVRGSVVQFVSAERAGAMEEIPTDLVDLEATQRYQQAHAPRPDEADPHAGRAPALDPELAREEAERASLTPEVAPDLRLATEDAVLLLDTFQGTPELVPLAQSGSDLNKSTGHSILKGKLNPLASSHQIVQIKGTRAPVQAHIDTPILYLRLGDDSAPTGSAPLIVDTHAAQGNAPTVPAGGAAGSRYVILQADVRQDVRILTSFKTNALGSVRRQEDVVETTSELLPGGHWVKLTPSRPLGFGEYALMELLSDRELNLSVWDFGIHPTAPENRDALHPESKRPVTLERHPRD